MKAKLAFIAWLLLVASPAWAQIYAGLGADGAVVLSNHEDEAAYTVLVEAEKLAVPVVKPPDTGDFPSIVPPTYWAFIQEASATYRIPTELIHAVILVESNYNARAVSPKGAQGLMQLMPATAKRFGGLNSWDPRQNILTGSKYLRWLMDFFGDDVELAVAAYNAGEMAVLHAGRKIPNYAETEKYVPKVLSIYKKARQLT
jgi:soluble lytic murein transglycosylase-like protein